MRNFWLAEVLLALAALLVASQYWFVARDHRRPVALLVVAAMLFLALAASVGAYRYGINPYITDLHRALSNLSGFLTFALVGLALAWMRFCPGLGGTSRGAAYAVITLLIGAGLAASEFMPAGQVSTLFSSVGIVAWLLVALSLLLEARWLPRPMAILLLIGACLVLVASLFVGTSATRLLGLARLNWFHLLLAGAVLTLIYAIPLFERKLPHES